MKPVNSNQYGYKFREKTWYSNHHLGLDIVAPTGTPLFAPEAGRVLWKGFGTQGGYTIHFRGKSGLIHRFLHLSDYAPATTGKDYAEGDQLGKVGNTGMKQENGKPMIPHLHWDISLNGKIDIYNINNFIDPLAWLDAQTVGDGTFDKRAVIEQWGEMLGLFGHPQFSETDFAIHMKARTPKELATGFKEYLKKWLAENRSISAETKNQIIEFITKL